jgi:ABC-type sugar transport system ATPase subunit
MTTPTLVESRQKIIELRGVSKSFGGVHALVDAGIHLYPGEVVGLVGDNGAGKSTLVKVMSGVLIPDKGEYLFAGKPVAVRGPGDANALGVHTVYQDLALCNNLDAVSNIFLGHEITGSRWLGSRIQRATAESQARDLLRRLRLSNLSLTRPVGAMSGGQRQNIAVARALLGAAKVILLDEPTAALSHAAAAQIQELIATLAQEGIAVLVISHDIHKFVLEVTDRIEVLRLGRNVASLDPRNVTGEQVVNAMVGGDAAINRAG